MNEFAMHNGAAYFSVYIYFLFASNIQRGLIQVAGSNSITLYAELELWQIEIVCLKLPMQF